MAIYNDPQYILNTQNLHENVNINTYKIIISKLKLSPNPPK